MRAVTCTVPVPSALACTLYCCQQQRRSRRVGPPTTSAALLVPVRCSHQQLAISRTTAPPARSNGDSTPARCRKLAGPGSLPAAFANPLSACLSWPCCSPQTTTQISAPFARRADGIGGLNGLNQCLSRPHIPARAARVCTPRDTKLAILALSRPNRLLQSCNHGLHSDEGRGNTTRGRGVLRSALSGAAAKYGPGRAPLYPYRLKALRRNNAPPRPGGSPHCSPGIPECQRYECNDLAFRGREGRRAFTHSRCTGGITRSQLSAPAGGLGTASPTGADAGGDDCRLPALAPTA